jgi:hypothetical protein
MTKKRKKKSVVGPAVQAPSRADKHCCSRRKCDRQRRIQEIQDKRAQLRQEAEQAKNKTAFTQMEARRDEARSREATGPYCIAKCRVGETARDDGKMVACGSVTCLKHPGGEDCPTPACTLNHRNNRLHPACCQQWVHMTKTCSGHTSTDIQSEKFAFTSQVFDINNTPREHGMLVCPECKSGFERCLAHLQTQSATIDHGIRVPYTWPLGDD